MKRLNFDKCNQRKLRHKRTFNRIKRIDNEDRLRLVVTKTNAHIFAQIIDNNNSKTLVSSSSLQLKLKNGNKENAQKVGADIAKKAIKLGIEQICFDRGGSKYHGRVAVLAQAARDNGLKF